MSKLRKVSLIVLALVVMVVGMGFSPLPSGPASCTVYYRIQPGDTLKKIGQKFGVSWQYLQELNGLGDPNFIKAGNIICVSTSATPQQPQPGHPPHPGYPPPPPPCYPQNPCYPPPSHPQPDYVPLIKIVAVSRDQSVTVQTYNFPANDTFNVLMGPYGSQGKGGIIVGSYSSGNGSSKQVSYPIPAQLAGSYRIAIRFQSNTGSGYFSYNWFYNNTTGSGTGNGGVQPEPGYSGYPTFSILAVQRNATVTIKGYNYPPNTKFDVYMGPMGTKAIGGYYVTSFNSGQGGTLTMTFNIPPEMYGANKIAIRTQGDVYYAYNWFWNNTAVDP
jgi:LysM repeat protein